jgi:hypothetical protein
MVAGVEAGVEWEEDLTVSSTGILLMGAYAQAGEGVEIAAGAKNDTIHIRPKKLEQVLEQESQLEQKRKLEQGSAKGQKLEWVQIMSDQKSKSQFLGVRGW